VLRLRVVAPLPGNLSRGRLVTYYQGRYLGSGLFVGRRVFIPLEPGLVNRCTILSAQRICETAKDCRYS
jgi:hypothetical protein